MVQGKVVADVGPGDGYATGRFVDAGASKVYPIDINLKNFDKELMQHPKVDCYEGDIKTFRISST